MTEKINAKQYLHEGEILQLQQNHEQDITELQSQVKEKDEVIATLRKEIAYVKQATENEKADTKTSRQDIESNL